MLSNHLAPSTSYSDRSDPQSNTELESLRDNNRQLSEALASAKQELSIVLENENRLKAKYLNLHVKYCRLEKLVRTNINEFSNILNEPIPYKPANQTRRMFPAGSQTQKTVKTQLVRPTINGHTIQVPRIALDRLSNIEFNSNSLIDNSSSDESESDIEENEAPALSRLISTQEQGADEPILTIPDNMENMRIVLERLPTNLSLAPLPEEPSNLNLPTPGESSLTGTDVTLVSQPTNTSLTNMVDSSTEMQQCISDTQLNATGCSSNVSAYSSGSNNQFSSLSQLAAMKMSSPSSVRSRLRRGRRTNLPTSPPQQKNRKRTLNPKCSSTPIRTNRIGDDRIIMVLLDRREMHKLLFLRNPVVRIGRTLDNKTSSKTESRSTKKKNTAGRSSNLKSKTTARSDVGSQTRKIKRKPKNRQNDVVSESFIKR
nr:unnamed protein product [Callosobruchus analis]